MRGHGMTLAIIGIVAFTAGIYVGAVMHGG